MDDAGIDRRAAEADDEEGRKRGCIGIRWDQQRCDPAGEDAGADADHIPVAEPVGEEAAHETSGGNADVKQRRKRGGALGRKALDLRKIGAGPLHGRPLRGAIGEEAHQDRRNALDPEHTGDSLLRLRLCLGRAVDSPHGKRHEQEHRNGQLEAPHDAVAVVPRPICQRIAHDKRTDDRSNAPEAVQPAHMLRLVVQRHIVVERRVDGARAQPIGDGERDQHPEAAGNREAEQRKHRQKHAAHGHDLRPEPPGEPVGKQARHDRSAGNNHGHDAHIRYRHAKLGVHDRPAGAKQRIRQSQTDKGHIDQGK